jgi:opacity protein-like surface antigen
MKNSIIRMSLVIAVVALSVAVFSTPASAQFYFGGKGTAFLPNNSADGLKDFDTGYGGEAFAGYRFIPYFGLETGVGYYASKWSDSFDDIDTKLTASAVPVTLTAKGFLPLGDRARLYAGAGVGMYFAKAKVELSADIDGVKFSISDEDDASAFGYHAVLGGEFMVSSAVGLQAEAKWFKVEPEFSDDIADEKADIGGIMLSFGVLFQL